MQSFRSQEGTARGIDNHSCGMRYMGRDPFSTLLPILEELDGKFSSVSGKIFNTNRRENQVGGGFGVPLELIIEAAAVLVLKELISEFAKDAYRGLRDSLVTFQRNRRLSPQQNALPFASTFSNLALAYDSPITEDEFVASLRAARALSDSIPDDQLLSTDSSGRAIYEWDSVAGEWKGPMRI